MYNNKNDKIAFEAVVSQKNNRIAELENFISINDIQSKAKEEYWKQH